MLPTAATVLAGIGRWHGYDSTPSVCCFGFEDGTELRPTGIRDALGQAVVPYHVGDPQVFEIDRVVLLDQLQGFLVVEVLSLPLHLQVRFRQERDRLAAAMAPFLAPRHAPLRRLEPPFGFTIPAWITDVLAIGRRGKRCPAHVDARLLPGGWQRFYGEVGTGEADRVAVRFPADGDRLGGAL